MIRVKHVTTEQDEPHPVFGTVHVVSIRTVDETTGQPISNEQVRRAFNELDIVGVHVKLHHSKLSKPDVDLWPGFGVITAIDDTSVWLGNFEVPKQDFLEWYELD